MLIFGFKKAMRPPWHAPTFFDPQWVKIHQHHKISVQVREFKAFKQRAVEHNEETYGAEIRVKYGDQEADEANAAVMNLTQEQYREWADLGREIQKRLEAAASKPGCPRRARRARRSPPSTAGGSPSRGTGTTRPSTGGSPSSM